MDEIKKNYDERRRLSWRSGGGSPHIAHPKMTMEASPEERRDAFEKRWQLGGVLFSKTFPDQLSDPAANDEARRFYEEKVRALIDDPEVADLLIPDDHPIGTKRICTDSNYFQTFNRSDVELISVRKTPIESIDADRHQHHRRALRPRHDRARNGIRCDDGGAVQNRHRRPPRRGPARATGSTAHAPTWGWASTGFRTCSSFRDRARPRCWPTWCCTQRRT